MKYLLLALSLLLVSGTAYGGRYRAEIVSVTEHRTYERNPANNAECYDLHVYEDSDYYRDEHHGGGSVIGAIIGGVIGSRIGSGNGRLAATIAGGAIGASVGDNHNYNQRHYRRYNYRYDRYNRYNEGDCDSYAGYTRTYYEVIYLLHGRYYRTITYTYPRGNYIIINDY